MIHLLIVLLFLCLFVSVAIYIIRLFPWPAPFGNIAVAVVLLIFLLVVAEMIFSGGMGLSLR